MIIVLVGNAKSGRGVGRRLFKKFRTALERDGCRVIPLALGDPGSESMDRFDQEQFEGAHALVACGGDGTINALSRAAAHTATPLYHVPSGNENLFARAFGMDRRPTTLLKALKTRRVLWTDTGRCDTRRFLIMASVGPDAGVVRSLHFARTRALGHLAYAEPILREARRPTLPSMTVTVDGRVIAADRPGWLIVANAPQYAARINPASRAIASDGLLDAVFMPAANLRDCVNWVARAWTRQHLRDARLIYATGRHVTVEAPAPIVHQVDGEHSPEFDNGHPLTLSVEPRTLPVLCP